jgi:hypothetical protein
MVSREGTVRERRVFRDTYANTTLNIAIVAELTSIS